MVTQYLQASDEGWYEGLFVVSCNAQPPFLPLLLTSNVDGSDKLNRYYCSSTTSY